MVEVPDGRALRQLRVPNVILESDVLINVPKLKLYKRRASLSIKNLLGAVPGRGEFSQTPSPEFPIRLSREFWVPGGKFFLPHHRQWFIPTGEKRRVHTNFAEAIVDLNKVIRPSLTVIDGVIVLPDPNLTTITAERAKTLKLNTILASRDPLALDCIATRIGGLHPLEIPYLKRAAERGIGESDYNRIQVVGTPLDKVVKAWETGLASI